MKDDVQPNDKLSELDTRAPGSEPSWPVGSVAERVNVSASTLRSWERRYGIGPSVRTSGNHRRYTAADVDRVRLMVRLTNQGVPAQAAASTVRAMGDDIVRLRLGDGAAGAARFSQPALRDAGAAVEAIADAAAGLDARTLSFLYRQALRQHDLTEAWTLVLAPALRRIGQLWGEGALGVESEHLASELLGTELRAVVRANRLQVSGPPVLLGSADDEHHHLPLLALEAGLAVSGVPSILLGPRVPAAAMLSALERARPEKLFIWASLNRPPDEPFWRMVGGLSWPLRVIVGGPGWPADVSGLPGAGGVSVELVESFAGALDALLPDAGAPGHQRPDDAAEHPGHA